MFEKPYVKTVTVSNLLRQNIAIKKIVTASNLLRRNIAVQRNRVVYYGKEDKGLYVKPAEEELIWFWNLERNMF